MRHPFNLVVAIAFAASLKAEEPPTATAARSVALQALAQTEAEVKQLQAKLAAQRAALGLEDQEARVTVKMITLDHAKLRAKGVQFEEGRSALSSLLGEPLAPAEARIPTLRGDADHPAFRQIDSWLADADPAAKVIATPSIKSAVGTPAFVHVGHEFPVVVPQALGTTSIEYRRYGTQLDFRVELQDDGGVRLNVRPRHAELDPTRSVTIAGTKVPGLRVRECDVTAVLRPQQRLLISGLLQTEARREKPTKPWLKAEETIHESELLIVIDVELPAS